MKHVPDEQQIEQLLENTQLPSTARLEKRLTSAPWTVRAVNRRRTLRAASLIALAGILLLVVTPPGRAFAQSLFRFFVPAQRVSFPVPESSSEIDVSTPAPTFALPLATVPPSSHAPVKSPIPSCGRPSEYACQIALAELQVGFDAREFQAVPQGFVFAGVQSDAALRSLTINYDVFEGGGSLTLQQGEGDLLISTSSWGEVPASAIQKVEVNGNYAEFARGVFVVLPGTASATWNADVPVERLRWSEGDRWFSLEKFGDTAPVEYLDKEAMIALAASLVDRPSQLTIPSLGDDYKLSLAEVETAAGFDVLEPTILPAGFEFMFAQYDPAGQFVRMMYRPIEQDQASAGLLILQTPRRVAGDLSSCSVCPAGMEEQVQVNGTIAYYTRGALFTGSDIEPLSTPVWQPDDPNYSLTWATPDLIITINFSANEWYGGQISREDLIRIAESMVPVP